MRWINENESLATCDKCTLDGSKKVFSFLNEDEVEVLVCGQSPGKDEVKAGRPFVGESGGLINPIIQQYSKKVAYINALSCRPLDKAKMKDRTPVTAEKKSCRPRFTADFEHVVSKYQPRIILVFGMVAKKEMEKIVKRDEYKLLNIHYLDHPAHILRNLHMKEKFVANFHNIMRATFNTRSMDEIIKTFVFYDDSKREQFLSEVKNSRNLGADIETNKLEMFDLSFVIGSIAISCDEHTYWFDCREKSIHEYDVLMEVLADDRAQKIFADILFDVTSSTACNIDVKNYSDLFPLAFLYDNTFMEYNLEAITLRYFPELASYKSKFQKKLVDNSYLEMSTEELMEYNCFDAYVTRLLYNYLYDKLDAKPKMAFDKITVPVLPVLNNIKTTGIKLDSELLEEYFTLFNARYAELQQFFQDKYNISKINSTPQIRKWFYDDLKLKPVKFTKDKKKKTPSTDKEVIEVYAARIPDVRKLYEARRIANLLSYMLPAMRDAADACDILHPAYKHYGIQSFRLSCKSPNLQGIPRDDTKIEFLDKYPLRRLFMARRPNSYIVEFDYSQQEVRIVAQLSRDVRLIEAFKRGDDIHRFVASILFRKKQEEISKFERQVAKSCVFGAIFGASAREMSIRLRISEADAQAYLDEFFRLFSGIKAYIQRQHNTVLSNKCIYTILGRPRKFNIHQYNANDCKREAANHTIQSVAADITFVSLIKLYNKLKEDGKLNNGIDIIHTVHDSVLFDVDIEQLGYAAKVIPKIMSATPGILGFTIDFPVDGKIGKRWGEALEIKEVLKSEGIAC